MKDNGCMGLLIIFWLFRNISFNNQVIFVVVHFSSQEKAKLLYVIMSEDRGKKLDLSSNYVSGIGYIEEIMVNILSRLPVDSLLRCKSVNKFWCGLIREPKFAQLCYTSSLKMPKLILHRGGNVPRTRSELYLMDITGRISQYVTLPDDDRRCSLQLISSFNGLVCYTKLAREVGADVSIHIYNPATRDALNVPNGCPSSVSQSVGIIFAPNKNEYKVLRFFCDKSDIEAEICKCEVYNPQPNSGDWRIISDDIQCPVANPACPYFPTNVCIGGRMYWLVWSRDDHEVPDYILSVDMDDNFTRINLPEVSEGVEGFNIFTFLTEHNGRLTLVSLDNDEIYMDIWLLASHDDPSWLFEGSAELEIDGFVDAINSIVSVENELLFIVKPGFSTYFRLQFLNLADMAWRTCNPRRFRIGNCEPVSLPYNESIFRCDGTN